MENLTNTISSDFVPFNILQEAFSMHLKSTLAWISTLQLIPCKTNGKRLKHNLSCPTHSNLVPHSMQPSTPTASLPCLGSEARSICWGDLVHNNKTNPWYSHGAGIPCYALHTLWQPVALQCQHHGRCDQCEGCQSRHCMGHLEVSETHLDDGRGIFIVLNRRSTQQLHAAVAHCD